MSENILASALPERASALERLLRKTVHKRLATATQGRLVIRDPLGNASFGHDDAAADATPATITVRSLEAYRFVARSGGIGAAEAYIDGHWDTDDLVSVVRFFARNREHIHALDGGAASILKRWNAIREKIVSRNTRRGSEKNISSHYDLSNDFFQLFLDSEHRMYSSAVFPSSGATLEEASTLKLDRICQRLELKPEHHLLEIGTGWGGMAIYAARHYGCRVTTTTISQEQYEYARRRVAESGLSDQVTVLKRDYRDLDGRYDRIVSIEMVEAVGAEYLRDFFRRCGDLLKADGSMLLQAITIEERAFEFAARQTDFIKKHVFPGGCLPSVGAIGRSLDTSDGLSIVFLEDIGQHYAQTLRVWRERFETQLDEVLALGFDKRFIRLWRYYLCYCEGGFIENSIGTVQMLLAKRDAPRSLEAI